MNTSEVVPTMEPEYEKPAQAPATPAKRFSLDTNNKEKLATLLKLAAEAFKVVMACLLVVFVPQASPGELASCCRVPAQSWRSWLGEVAAVCCTSQ